ncbi:hypothetical protein [Saccharopolyspora taberi]|uniref:Lipoprotein n=1 Tax=Saccharopolyspora taberi TaxID=60895 RepID=A0ABN3VGE3_9PSEU
MKRVLIPLLFLLAACGSQPRPAVDPQVREQLVAGVDAVKAAATNHDRPAAEAALNELTRAIAAAQAQGRMDPAFASTVLAAADRVAEDVATMDLPAPPPPVTVTVPTPDPDWQEEQQNREEERREEQEKREEEHREQQQKKWEEHLREQLENHGRDG